MAEHDPWSAAGPGDSPLRSGPTSTGARRIRVWPGRPQALVLIAVLTIGLLAAGFLAGEIYARHRAERVVTEAVECAVHDQAQVSFGATPLLLQLAANRFRNISIHTAGNQIGDARGMRADVWADDVRFNGASEAMVTVGALNVVVAWSADGIAQSIQYAKTPLRGLVTKAQTDPDEGTVKLEGNLGSVTVKPQIDGAKVVLQVVDVTGLSSLLPTNIVQSAMDGLTTRLTETYPADIHADRVRITKDAVTAHYSARDISIRRDT